MKYRYIRKEIQHNYENKEHHVHSCNGYYGSLLRK